MIELEKRGRRKYDSTESYQVHCDIRGYFGGEGIGN